MSEIYLVKKGIYLIPAMDSDKEEFNKLKNGETYRFKFSRPRNVKFHRKFFALINLVYQNQEHYTSADHLRYDLTIESGYYDIRVNKFTGEEIKVAKSIAFASMDEVEFSKLYGAFLTTVVRVFGWDGADIEANISEFM